ncbi:52 kDa repressor of the inhibitor of the protein kinase-like isoform X2 [Sipha flava]|nr:52 kDa repressor of the inhibitor of the protein kinase-like isoform X2 [Sipha flava]
MRCSVRFCNRKTSDKDLSFFNYPADVERRALWIKACETQRKVSFNPKYQNSFRVCGDHFEKHMFLNQITKNRLVFNAVPTLFNDEILDLRRNLKKRTIYSELIEDTDNEILSDVEFENPESLIEPSLDISYNSSSSFIQMSSPIQSSLSENYSNELSTETYIKPELGKINQLLNAVILLSQQLKKYESEEDILKLCDKYLSPELFKMVKLHMDVKLEMNVDIENNKYIQHFV